MKICHLITNLSNGGAEKMCIELSNEQFRKGHQVTIILFDPINEKMRNRMREQMQIKREEIVVIFSTGGGDNWQNSDLIVQLANAGFKIINLSNKEYSHPNIINKFVNYQDVPKYLCAADIGFIWRNESIVNLVASPVKFAEYLSFGLPVISNGNVGQINDITMKYGLGIIESDVINLTIEKISSLINSFDRDKTSLIGHSYFSSDIAAENYWNTYFGV